MKTAHMKLKLIAFAGAIGLSMGVAQADSLDGPDWMPPKAPQCAQADTEWGQSNIEYLSWSNKGWVQWHPQTGPTVLSQMGTQCYFCDTKVPDCDGDGVMDPMDKCPGTPKGTVVDNTGCPLDSDQDGVVDSEDQCPDTPRGVTVDTKGCPLDTDGDGVVDYKDKCPGTPMGTPVNSDGCPMDSDGDGVQDHKDQCPDTPKGATVNTKGCWILKGVHFNSGKWDILSRYNGILNQVASVLEQNPGMKVQISGHTDNRGNAAFNQRLSQHRAESVRAYMISRGISADRLTSAGYGLERPIADNGTASGRATNRRVELNPVK